MNREMLRRVADVIELEGRFNLSTFGARECDEDAFISGPVDLLNDCGTVGCVCGWTNALTGHGVNDHIAASCALGLDPRQAASLFVLRHPDLSLSDGVWKRHSGDLGWEGLDYSDITAVQASKMLRWIADGEVEL